MSRVPSVLVWVVAAGALAGCSCSDGRDDSLAAKDLPSSSSGSFCARIAFARREGMAKDGATFEGILREPERRHGKLTKLAGDRALFVLSIPGYLTSDGSTGPLSAYGDYHPFEMYTRTVVLRGNIDFFKHDGYWKKFSKAKRAALTKDLGESMRVAIKQAKQIDTLIAHGYCGK